jgi:hypothetical protein
MRGKELRTVKVGFGPNLDSGDSRSRLIYVILLIRGCPVLD